MPHNLPGVKDLTQEAPRSPKLRLGGYAIIARTIDKCRAHINGTVGEYHFDCPLDNMLFGFKNIKGVDFKTFVETGASDDEIVAWVDAHGDPKTPAEITAWGDQAEKEAFQDKPEKRAWLEGEFKRLDLPMTSTLFEFLDVDDKVSYQK